ncbi:MAG: GH3 auxin-responsive promoter [Legionella sp.]|nr:MAG: GH3 auxin-responsive promoter [Legionella sp.]
MNWKRMLIATLMYGKYRAFIKDTEQPQEARERLWQKEILPLMQRSAYWPKRMKSLELDDYAITQYEDYQSELLAAQNSRIQPFNGEELIFWSETSGTAGARKFFPITASFQKQFQRTMPPYIYSLTQRFSGFFKQKILYLVAIDANKFSPAGIPSGWISNFNYRHLPAFIRNFYAMPPEVFANHEVYNEWAGVYALATDLSAIFAVTPMVIEAFYHQCVEKFNHFLPYLLEEKALPDFLPPLKINKKRQAYLKQLTQFNFKSIWPSLEFAGCWTSGLCEFPAQQLQQLMGPDIALVDGTYSATEGWLTVPLETGTLGGVLHPGAHIVEFIEEGQDIQKGNLIQSWELDVGKKYEVFLTTAMGFVRYRLRDIVMCTGFLNCAPQLEFCYKTQLLKLESCAVTGQELQEMLHTLNFKMEPHWYFARNSLGNRIILVVDDLFVLPPNLLSEFHQQLIDISPTYAHSVETGEVVPMEFLQLSKAELLADAHAQTKPKLISQQVITQR